MKQALPHITIAGHQGSFQMVGEVIQTHWTATACLKLSSPQPIRCCPTTGHLPHWVHGTQDISDKWTVTTAPNNYKRSTKKPALRFGCWNVNTMMINWPPNHLWCSENCHHQQWAPLPSNRHCYTTEHLMCRVWMPEGVWLHLLLAKKEERGCAWTWHRFCSQKYATQQSPTGKLSHRVHSFLTT